MVITKEQTTSLDTLPLPGLAFKDGLQLVKQEGCPTTIKRNKGEKPLGTEELKYPIVDFPSRGETELFPTSDGNWRVAISNREALCPLLLATRDQAFNDLRRLRNPEGVTVKKIGLDTIEIQILNYHYVFVYDNEQAFLVDCSVELNSPPRPPKNSEIRPYVPSSIEPDESLATHELPPEWEATIHDYAERKRTDWGKLAEQFDPSVHPRIVGYIYKINAHHRLFTCFPVIKHDNGLDAIEVNKETASVSTWAISPTQKNFVVFDEEPR